MGHFNDELSFFVFLAVLEGVFLEKLKKERRIRTLILKAQRATVMLSTWRKICMSVLFCFDPAKNTREIFDNKFSWNSRDSWVYRKEKKLGQFTYVFPSQRCFTALAINVGNCVKACQQNPFLSRTATHVHSAKKKQAPKTVSGWNTTLGRLFTTMLLCKSTYTLLNK